MIKGTTKSGFEYQISDEALNDYEVFEALCELDGGRTTKLPMLLSLLLGENQAKTLKEHLRQKNGRVPLTAMVDEIQDILSGSEQGKNL